VSQSTNAWDEIFAREGRVFLEPHEDMPRIVQMLKERVPALSWTWVAVPAGMSCT
jgi:hypothetical protein